MKQIQPGAISEAVLRFLGGASGERPPSRRRERSWDFCYTHFRDHPRPTEVMELSCLHLGYYLASWGMLRGSSYLFQETNALHYQRAVEVIEEHNDALRGWDADRYDEAAKRQSFEQAWTDLRTALIPADRAGLTLISKVMMGVWGCIPSFDTYFRATFEDLAETSTERQAWNRAGTDALTLLHTTYQCHREEIEAVRLRYPVWSIRTGAPTARPLTAAKVLDIYGFHASWAQGGSEPPSSLTL